MIIFLSYSRKSESITKNLAEHIQALGHTVWFDKELNGGQKWWDRILEMVRNCDVFVVVLEQNVLDSIACKREFGYADALDKPILPILVSDGLSTNLLPFSLSRIQFVDYRNQDRDAAFRLAKAIAAVPPPTPLPDPLPPSPEVPISYIGSLAELVETTSTLSFGEQSALVVNLKKCLRESVTPDDTLILINKLRKRRDLLAIVAEEIDDLLENLKEKSLFSHDVSDSKAPTIESPQISESIPMESSCIKKTEAANKLSTNDESSDVDSTPRKPPNISSKKMYQNLLDTRDRSIVIGLVIFITLIFLSPFMLGNGYPGWVSMFPLGIGLLILRWVWKNVR